ncbi:783_t:CDS:1 [Funneliformis caledonium]|uniref:783_t:CDS:1 n=1 Tax=Funneliformis caledonium TaxID=1117310 RepID=A0A9N9G3P1_9GLOM|nr:783_t:CDS:1 [Funneliformis caledonium]
MSIKRHEDLTLPSIPSLPPFPSKIHLSDPILEIPLTLPSIRTPLMKIHQELPSLKSLGLISGNPSSSIPKSCSPTFSPQNFPQSHPHRQEFRFVHHRQHQDNFRPYHYNRFRLSSNNPDVSSSTKVNKKSKKTA